MPIVPRSLELQAELTRIRRDIHAHPELAYEEHRTSDIVAAKLTEWGLEVHRGLGKTGVVGTLRKGNSPKAVGLRADMDALPMQETNEFEHRSTNTGRMHACGHDGHTTMLLGAAKVMAETRNFEGAVHFIFQPAEEGGGGAKAMIDDGLFEKFPCDAVFAIHNKPGLKLGTIATKPGPLLAAADRWDIRIKGHGGHAAHPHLARDPIVIGSQVVMALQGIVARNTDPLDAAVVTVGFMKGGSAYNVIPGEMHIGGTTRTTTVENRAMVERRMREICAGAAAMHGVEISVEHRAGYGPTINDADKARFAADVAAEVCGEANILRTVKPSMGAEDFSYMLNAVPGAMVWLGNGISEQGLHNPGYDFNDQAIPFGVSFFVRAAERFLSKDA
ncbi:MAG: amidohydrolase [Alphaproteobacteria bacterium]|nr:amidohydrolase [Alphaproteobacteria bacterium]